MRKYMYFLLSIIILSSCSNEGTPVKVTKEMENIMSDYILDYNQSRYFPSDLQFEAHKIYGAREINGNIEIYLYSVYAGFNASTKKEWQAAGSYPILIKMKKVDDTYRVIEYKEPGDGAMYETSIKEMFPANLARKAMRDTGNVKDLEKEIERQVEDWLNSL